MKKKIVAIIFGVSLCLSMNGCGNANNDTSNNVVESESDYIRYSVYEWVSPDGVHYWVHCGRQDSSFAPRYDANGQLIIDK